MSGSSAPTSSSSPNRRPPGGPSAQPDSFVRTLLPPDSMWPEMDYSGLPELAAYPDRMNAAALLLDGTIEAGHGDRPALYYGDAVWSYRQLRDLVCRIARVLVEDFGLVAGNRVLLRGTNTPMMVACWFATLRAGGVVVATMPLLRARELTYILNKAKISIALTDYRLVNDLAEAASSAASLNHLAAFTPLADGSQREADLDRFLAAKDAAFPPVETSADDVALIAFTSGTTGDPKGTVHFHRDVMAITDCFPRYINRIDSNDLFIGSPPLAFTFGLGAQVLFPFRFGAATVLLDQPSPENLLEAIPRYKPTGLYTAPTAYRALAREAGKFDLSSLKKCVSAGEHLPKPTWEGWRDATGLEIIDGIGSTELLHIFISAPPGQLRPGATGKAIPGYRAQLQDDEGHPLPQGAQGKLAVIGPTGCRYLDNLERQQAYVRNGWNLTGDVYEQDKNGYFWYVARADDMIISAGYNISGPEVERVLLEHAKVHECAVIGAPDAERGQIVKAFVVLKNAKEAGPETVKELQDFVKRQIAPYKYPRSIVFKKELPKTQTGKLQRFRLREE
jgi:2-aminobenzoate-CoA ligase